VGENFTSSGNVELVMVCFRRFPEDGTPVPKHVGGGACHELCSVTYILLFIVCIVSVIMLDIRKFAVRIT
jgi:hypothetical protein